MASHWNNGNEMKLENELSLEEISKRRILAQEVLCGSFSVENGDTVQAPVNPSPKHGFFSFIFPPMV